ncbi:ImuA family protein [Marivita hallyeonensis]|nr:hypothetical protein [Marivita hallyeonensis]
MKPASTLLSRRSHRAFPEITLGDAEIALRLGRVHELCGAARHTLALAVTARAGGPAIWITASDPADSLCPDAIAEWINPGDILFVKAMKRDTLLWAMEEALRDGQAPVVIADLPGPPGMVPVRRLHLAAEAGCGKGLCHPLALLLTPEDGGAPGIETRWALHAAHRHHTPLWKLDRLRARMAPPKQWVMTCTKEGLSPNDPAPDAAVETHALDATKAHDQNNQGTIHTSERMLTRA